MEQTSERRKEQRLRYHWPVWFAEDFNHILSQGQMIDVSSQGAAFTCYADQDSPCPGQEQTIRFSVPRFESNDSFGMASFTRKGRVCRVENSNPFLRKIAIQFAVGREQRNHVQLTLIQGGRIERMAALDGQASRSWVPRNNVVGLSTPVGRSNLVFPGKDPEVSLRVLH